METQTFRQAFTDLSCCYLCESKDDLQDAVLDDGYRTTEIKLCKVCFEEEQGGKK